MYIAHYFFLRINEYVNERGGYKISASTVTIKRFGPSGSSIRKKIALDSRREMKNKNRLDGLGFRNIVENIEHYCFYAKLNFSMSVMLSFV